MNMYVVYILQYLWLYEICLLKLDLWLNNFATKDYIHNLNKQFITQIYNANKVRINSLMIKYKIVINFISIIYVNSGVGPAHLCVFRSWIHPSKAGLRIRLDLIRIRTRPSKSELDLRKTGAGSDYRKTTRIGILPNSKIPLLLFYLT